VTKRKGLSKKLRFEIFKRDEFICQYCGNHPPVVILEVDHIVPVVDGGVNDMDNLTTSCFDCNRGKAANSLESIPESLKEKAIKTKEAEDQLKLYSEIMKGKRDRVEAEAWGVVNMFDPDANDIDRAWFTSIKWYVDKIGYFDALESMEIAISRFPHPQYSKTRAMKYFHGICKRKVAELCDG